jgi:hypothetical protein
MKKIGIGAALVISVLSLIPLIWAGDLSVDLAKFTEEWYRGVFKLVETFLLAVALVYVFERIKMSERKDLIGLRVRMIRDGFVRLLPDIRLLLEYVEGVSDRWVHQASATQTASRLRRVEVLIKGLSFMEGVGMSHEAEKIIFSFSPDVENSFRITERLLVDGNIAFAENGGMAKTPLKDIVSFLSLAESEDGDTRS